ncbi:MAG: ABC transporter transmembrane domain-containing protein, partial [Cytophagales bacterium]
MNSLRAVNKYFHKYRFRLGLGILFVTLSNIFATMQPIIVREAFDKVEAQLKNIDGGTLNQTLVNQYIMTDLMMFGLVILGLALVSGFFLFLTRQTIIVMSRLVEYDMKDEIYQHFQQLPASFYRKNNTGDLMAKISEDVGKVRMYFGPAVMYGINLIITTIMTIVFMLSVNHELTFYALIPLPFLSISIYYISKKIERKSTELQESLSEVSVHVQEGFSGIRVLKAFANQSRQAFEINSKSENYRLKALSLTRTNSFFHPLMIGLIGMSIVLVLLVGGFQVMEGKITVGNIAEFVMYITRLTWPVTAVGWVTSIIQRAEASQKRINELLAQKNDILDGEETIDGLKNEI